MIELTEYEKGKGEKMLINPDHIVGVTPNKHFVAPTDRVDNDIARELMVVSLSHPVRSRVDHKYTRVIRVTEKYEIIKTMIANTNAQASVRRR